MISNIHDLDNINIDKKCLRVLSLTPPCYSNVASICFQAVQLYSTMGHYIKKLPSWYRWGGGGAETGNLTQ